MFLLLGFVSLLIIWVYTFLSSNYTYWKKRGVKNPPVSIIFGNLGASLTMKCSVSQLYNNIYNLYPNERYVGFYKIRQPGILLRDPELIKDALIKEFNSFHDNDLEIDETVDPVGARNPFVLKGDRWKAIRNQISPCFTSKKIKIMYPLLEDAVKKLIHYLETEPNANGFDGLESKELSGKYTTEVVANCVFGLEGNIFDNPNSEFKMMGNKIFHPSVGTIIKHLLLLMAPSMTKLLKVGFFSKEVTYYFRKITMDALKYRQEKNIVRNDFLDLMKNLQVKLGDGFTNDDIVAHALGFFTDGFETSSAVISYTLFELAANFNTQEKLLEEINMQKTLDFDTINEMQYLDAVINESLRMHPPGMLFTRLCTKPFVLPPPSENGTEVLIEVGTPVYMPIYALHYDAKYYQDPQQFDPNRFLDKSREFRNKGVFVPFGEGPRACHGQRFGLTQVKVAIVHVVKNFEIKINNKTKMPLEIDPKYLIAHAKGGIWLNFYKRN